MSSTITTTLPPQTVPWSPGTGISITPTTTLPGFTIPQAMPGVPGNTVQFTIPLHMITLGNNTSQNVTLTLSIPGMINPGNLNNLNISLIPPPSPSSMESEALRAQDIFRRTLDSTTNIDRNTGLQIKILGARDTIRSFEQNGVKLAMKVINDAFIDIESSLILHPQFIYELQRAHEEINCEDFREFVKQMKVDFSGHERELNDFILRFNAKGLSDWDKLVWALTTEKEVAKSLDSPALLTNLCLSNYFIKKLQEKGVFFTSQLQSLLTDFSTVFDSRQQKAFFLLAERQIVSFGQTLYELGDIAKQQYNNIELKKIAALYALQKANNFMEFWANFRLCYAVLNAYYEQEHAKSGVTTEQVLASMTEEELQNFKDSISNFIKNYFKPPVSILQGESFEKQIKANSKELSFYHPASSIDLGLRMINSLPKSLINATCPSSFTIGNLTIRSFSQPSIQDIFNILPTIAGLIVKNGGLTGERVLPTGARVFTYKLRYEEYVLSTDIIVSFENNRPCISILNIESELAFTDPSISELNVNIENFLWSFELFKQSLKQENTATAAFNLAALVDSLGGRASMDKYFIACFQRWLGLNIVDSGFNPEQKAKLMLGQNNLPERLETFFLNILEYTLTHHSNDQIIRRILKTAIEPFSGFKNEACISLIHYRAVTRRHFEEVKKIKAQIEELTGMRLSESLKSVLISQLQIRALHFLSHCSRLPVFGESHGIRSQLAVSAYDLSLGNHESYYRGTNGPFDYCVGFLQRNLTKFRLHPILNGQYPNFIQNFCKNFGITYLPPINRTITNLLPDQFYFDDLSDLVPDINDPIKKIEIVNVLLQFHQSKYVQNSQTNVTVGVKISIYRQDFIMVYREDSYRILSTLEGRRVICVSEEIKTYTPRLGLLPDLVDMKWMMLKLGYKIETDLLKLFPFTDLEKLEKGATELEDEASALPARYEKLVTHLNVLVTYSKSKITYLYGSMLLRMLNALLDEKRDLQIDPVAKKYFYQCLGEMLEGVKELYALDRGASHEGRRFNNINAQAACLFESFERLLIYSGKKFDLKKALDENPKLTLQMPSIKGANFIFTSGMGAYTPITQALLDFYPLREHAYKLKSVYVKLSYYELNDLSNSFNFFFGEDFEKQVVDINEFDSKREQLSQADILYTPMFPNYVTEKAVQNVDITRLVKLALDSRSPNRGPLTLVIDTASTIFFDPQIQSKIRELAPFIAEKKLIVVLTNSLAKFPLSGLDKYGGGLDQLYAHPSYYDKIDFNFSLNAGTEETPPVLSLEANRFFALFFSECSELIWEYISGIQENTHYIYESLKPSLTPDSAIFLGTKTAEIPMLAFHFDAICKAMKCNKISEEAYLESLTMMLKWYIFSKASHENLPLLIRLSFNFVHSALQDCGVVLRMTVGLEDKVILKRYVRLILQINLEIEELLKNPEKLNLLIFAIKNRKVLENYYEENSYGFEESAREGFNRFLSFLISFIQQPSVIPQPTEVDFGIEDSNPFGIDTIPDLSYGYLIPHGK